MRVRKIGIYLCTVLLTLSFSLEYAFAGITEGNSTYESMTDSMAWSKANGELQISGSGAMPHFEYGTVPWTAKNSMATPQDVIVTAEKEIGYHEKLNGRELYKTNENNGENNFTKYAYELSKIKGSGISNPAEWCDIFVDWCMNYTYGTSRAKSLICGGFCGYTPNKPKLLL